MMPEFIAGKVVKLMIQKGIQIKNANALILGITLKKIVRISEIRKL
jgi:UDP-N-acetyl-D-galactosamine dehydrogenase